MPFTNAAIYWRDAATEKGLVSDPASLPAAQIIEFNDTSQVLASVIEAEQPNVSEDPVLDASGSLTIEKQFNGTFGGNVALIIISDESEVTFRKKLRTFARKVSIEPAFHEFGIFGFSHPKVTDFNIDPTADFGYTIDSPSHEFIHGSNFVKSKLTLRIGGKLDQIP